MGNYKIFLLGALAIFSFFLSGCKDSTTVDASSNGSPFFVKDINRSILTAIEPEILALINKDLVSKGKTEDAVALLKTYNIKTGKLYQQVAVPEKSARTSSAYTVYIRSRGEYQDGWVNNQPLGGVIGTTGQNQALMAFQLDVNPLISGSASIQYQAHVADRGWEGWKNVGEPVGSPYRVRGSKAIQAVQFNVNPSFATQVFYRAHVQDRDWQPYVSNGQTAGTVGEHLNLEAFQLTMLIY